MIPAGRPPEPLWDRECGVLVLLARGLSNRDIAEKLVITEGTLKNTSRARWPGARLEIGVKPQI